VPHRQKLLFRDQHFFAVKGVFVPCEAKPHEPRDNSHCSHASDQIEVKTQNRILTSIGASLRLPILHAASIAPNVGTNPSAIHAIISNGSIANMIGSG
jgi:hypothetical protein